MEPDAKPVLPSTVRKSALPSLPKEAFVPEPVQQVYLFSFSDFHDHNISCMLFLANIYALYLYYR